METHTSVTVKLDHFSVELMQPLRHRPDVIVVCTSDGRRAILGDGREPFTPDEYLKVDSTLRSLVAAKLRGWT